MSPYDQILIVNAKKHMIQFDLVDFKKSHPRLYKTIIESMKQAQNHSN